MLFQPGTLEICFSTTVLPHGFLSIWWSGYVGICDGWYSVDAHLYKEFCSSGALGWEEQAGSVSSFRPIWSFLFLPGLADLTSDHFRYVLLLCLCKRCLRV